MIVRRFFHWIWNQLKPSAAVLILFGAAGQAAVVNSVVGSGDVTAIPSTGNVIVGRVVLIDTGPCVAGAYTIPTTDVFKLVAINSAVDCTVTLPPNTSSFPMGTQLRVSNTSNLTYAPPSLVGTALDCAGGSGSTCSAAYTVQGTGHLLRHHISIAGSNALVSMTDGAGDACALIPGTAVSNGSNYRAELWSCKNTKSATLQTFTLTFAGSNTNNWDGITEWSKADLVSPDDQANSATGTQTTPTLSLAGTARWRGEVIDAGFNNISGTPPTHLQTGYPYNSGGFGDQYLITNSVAQYTLNWTSSGAIYVATIAGIKPANPVSMLTLCPGAGTVLQTPTLANGCTPLPAGFKADIVVVDSTHYEVEVFPPAEGLGPMVDAITSFSMTLENCREPLDFLGFNSSSPIVVTASLGLPPCFMPMKQGGSAKAQIAVPAGMLFEAEGGSGFIYTGGQGSAANLAVSGTVANFNGIISNTNP